MENDKYWIFIQSAFGYGSDKPAKILEKYEKISDFFEDEINWDKLKFIDEKKLELLHNKNFKESEKCIEYCHLHNITICTLDDEIYPVLLKRIKNPPAVLYVKGTMPDFDNEVGISMVGTRNCTLNSMIIASTLAFRLAQAGALVISGGANGIDTKCSQGALYSKKPSVIIRPCGVNNGYLNNLHDIREKVSENGAVISEVKPLDGIPHKAAFQIRNRIIAALCLGLVVIEAPKKSGALITASYALEMGKDIFAIPGDISSISHAGSNALLQDGANVLYCPKDVLSEYFFAFPEKLSLESCSTPINEDDVFLRLQRKYSKPITNENTNIKVKSTKTNGIKSIFKRKKLNEDISDNKDKVVIHTKLEFETDEEVQLVFDALKNKSLDVDTIVKQTKLSTSDVLYGITELEINGVIKSLPGGRYEIL